MTATPAKLIDLPRIADARSGIRHVFIRDLVLPISIGVHDFEHDAPQRVRINLDLAVFEGESPIGDNIQNVVCYEEITTAVRNLAQREHINLVETFCEDVAEVCLTHLQVRSVRVRVEKLDVFDDVASVGVEIERFNPNV